MPLENTGAISRPKVRFSQFSDNVQNKEKEVEHYKEKNVSRVNTPKIKSIVSLKKPVRIVDPKKLSTSVNNKDVLQGDHNTEISTHSSDIASENIHRNTFPSNKNVPKIETSKILRNANDIQNIKENYNTLRPEKNPQDNILKDGKKSLQQKGKENRDITPKKVAFSKDVSKTRRGSSQYIQSVAPTGNYKFSTSNNTQKNTMDSKKSPKMTKSLSAPNIMKRSRNQMLKETINTKSATLKVMPCYKSAAKKKVSPVKKTILRNVSGPKIKTSVGPGVSHKKKNYAKVDDTNKKHILDVVTAEELERPGYNSIACTINKLKELKQQKIVRDIDHLPSAQKSFVNGKVRFFFYKKHFHISPDISKFERIFFSTDFYSTGFSTG